MPQETIDEILINMPYSYYEDGGIELEIDGAKQALADLLLGLPSLQDDPIPNADSSDFSKRYDALVAHENWFKKRIRHEIAELLGVKEVNKDA